MNIYRKFKTDTAAEIAGVWVDIESLSLVNESEVRGDGKAYFRIARWNNPRNTARLEELKKDYREQVKAGIELEDSLATEMLCESASEFVLLDWMGVKDESETEVGYSKEFSKKFLIELKDFRELIFKISELREVYNSYTLERVKKS